MDGTKEPTTMSRSAITEALKVLTDVRNHPVLIHCKRGKHRTGRIVGCLRKWQSWCVPSVMDEYKYFDGAKWRETELRFLETYDVAKWRETELRFLETYDVSCVRHCLKSIISTYYGSTKRHLLYIEEILQKKPQMASVL